MDCVTDHVSTLGCWRSLTRQASRDCRALRACAPGACAPGACAPAPVRVIILPAPAVGQATRLGLPGRAGAAPCTSRRRSSLLRRSSPGCEGRIAMATEGGSSPPIDWSALKKVEGTTLTCRSGRRGRERGTGSTPGRLRSTKVRARRRTHRCASSAPGRAEAAQAIRAIAGGGHVSRTCQRAVAGGCTPRGPYLATPPSRGRCETSRANGMLPPLLSRMKPSETSIERSRHEGVTAMPA